MPCGRYFADWVVDEVYQLVGRNHGDLTGVTTLDSRAQGEAERAVDRVMDRDGDKLDAGQAALVSLTPDGAVRAMRSEEHTSELQSLMRISYAVFCLQKKTCRPIYKHLYHHKHSNVTHTSLLRP